MPRKTDPNTLKFQFKPLTVPEAIETTFTEWQSICVPVPIPLIPYLTPIMRIWQSPGCLIGTDSEKALFILLWSNLIASINGGDDCASMFKLRQKPGNSCVLEQSLDNGDTWVTAFDYALCRPVGTNYLIDRSVQNDFTLWHDATSPTDIHPDAPTETFTSSAGDSPETIQSRELALCTATREYVYAYCEAVRIVNEDAATASNLVSMGLGIAAAISAILAAPSGGSSLALYMALSAAMLAGGVAAYTSLTSSILDDEIAKNGVACCLFLTLKGAPINQENFAFGVNACPGLTANGELIRATLANDISNAAQLENQFNAFIEKLGQNYRPAQLGLLDDCSCEFTFITPVIAHSLNACIDNRYTGHGILTHDTGDYYFIETQPVFDGHAFVIKDILDRAFRYTFDSMVSGVNVQYVAMDNRNGGSQVCRFYNNVSWQEQNQYLLQLCAWWSTPAKVRLRLFF